MIRRLADRLVAVDLLDQASELLQYQVDHRLEGAARAQVAARLAMVYLTNRKPDRAIAALRTTRIADLSGELRQQRLLLEARAQSDVGRHDLALDIISNITGREAIRLRSDIYWASRRWREASEQIELYYADRWRDFKPLNPVEKGDVIRAVVGYALAEDAIGLARFREKYAPLMSGDADRAAFETASKPTATTSAEFAHDRQDGGQRRYARRLPARNEDPIPRCDRESDAAAGRAEGRSVPDRLAAPDRRQEEGLTARADRCASLADGMLDHPGRFQERFRDVLFAAWSEPVAHRRHGDGRDRLTVGRRDPGGDGFRSLNQSDLAQIVAAASRGRDLGQHGRRLRAIGFEPRWIGGHDLSGFLAPSSRRGSPRRRC